MKDFREFGIKPESKGLVGEKININKVLNVNIVVEAFRDEPSKFEGKDRCLHLQFIYNGAQRVLFISSKSLLEMIKKVSEKDFPFKAKIIKEESGRLIFTGADN